MKNNKDNHKPAYIEIVHPTHTYTATVFELGQLTRYCSDLVESGVKFRIGNIDSYGDLDIDSLVRTLNSLRKFGTYDRKLEKVN